VKAAFAMRHGLPAHFFTPDQLSRLRGVVEIDTDTSWQSFTEASPTDLAELEILITGWKAPLLDTAALAAMPRLRAVVHSAGSVKSHLPTEVWDRGITVTSAAWANAIPVAELTLALILIAGKRVVPISRAYARTGRYPDLPLEYPTSGNFGTTVGIIGASLIGRKVIELLHPFDVNVLVADPYFDTLDAAELGVESVPLHELLSRSHVVSLHAPDLPSTRRMLGAAQFALMGAGTTFVNTARQALVDQDALLTELRTGRLNAMLDVTEPEPLGAAHELFTLPNVLVTPHVAGAHGNELFRLGASALDEVERIVAGREPAHPVTLTALATMA
jgi:phosphoglycerate dehydrogenase-like enzyme